jgi:hypothetical protein
MTDKITSATASCYYPVGIFGSNLESSIATVQLTAYNDKGESDYIQKEIVIVDDRIKVSVTANLTDGYDPILVGATTRINQTENYVRSADEGKNSAIVRIPWNKIGLNAQILIETMDLSNNQYVYRSQSFKISKGVINVILNKTQPLPTLLVDGVDLYQVPTE